MMCCYYPTTTVAIDDDIDFLTVITQHLGIADCISYSSPSKAIESLKNKNPLNRIYPRLSASSVISGDINTTIEDYSYNINLHRLHEEIYSNDRFHDPSILIVDYHMDEVCGIDLCETLLNHPAKKILLTGSSDKEKIAIDAFNKGIINRFINKSDPNFPIQLKQAVTILKEAYFRDFSAKLLPCIPDKNGMLLQNPTYINFVKNLQDQFNIVEYYLLDTLGSILFFDENGNPLWLIIKHETEINNYLNIAKDQDAKHTLIDALTNRKMIPFFFSNEDFQLTVFDWDNHLYPAHVLAGVNEYYYALIKGHIRNNLNREKITPYTMQKCT